MGNRKATLGQILFILTALGILGFLYTSGYMGSITGHAALEKAEVFTGSDEYDVGDMAHVFVVPASSNHSVEVLRDGALVAVSKDFPVEKVGNYTVIAVIQQENITKELSTSFIVKEPEDAQEPEKQAEKDNNLSETPAAKSTPTNNSEKSDSAAGVQKPKVNESISDSENKHVGKKIKDEEDFETFFTFIGRINDSFVISFHHNSTATQPVWVEGDIEHNLTKESAAANETINLTIPVRNRTRLPRFRLHIGPDSEVFEFDIEITIQTGANGTGSSVDLNRTRGVVPERAMNRSVNFTRQDMVEETITENGRQVRQTVMDKEGVRINVRGAGRSEIRNVRYNNGVLHVDAGQIEEATIMVPHEPLQGITTAPKLYVKEDNETEFRPAEPYKKGNKTYNRVEVTPTHYEFNVEHFSDYTVEQGAGFECLATCLEWIEGTSDTCVISSGEWAIENCNNTNITNARIYDINDTILKNSSPDTNYGSQNYLPVGKNAAGLHRALLKMENDTLHNNIFSGEITGISFSFAVRNVWDNKPTIRFYRLKSGNYWEEMEATWNDRIPTQNWAGEAGCNLSGTDYYAWSSGDPEIFINNEDRKTVTIPVEWYNYWKNTSNNGFLIKDNDESTEAPFEMHAEEAGVTYNYFLFNITNHNSTAKADYSFNGTPIQTGGSDITLDCKGARLTGDATGSDIGIDINHPNVTIKNCKLKGIDKGFDIDGKNVTLINNTIEGEQCLDIGGGDTVVNNTDCNHTKNTNWAVQIRNSADIYDLLIYNATVNNEIITLYSTADNVTIEDLEIKSLSGSKTCIQFAGSTNRIEDGTIKNSLFQCNGGKGIGGGGESYDSQTIQNNTFRHTSIGIELPDSANYNSILSNTIYNASTGIKVDGTSNTIENNTLNKTGNSEIEDLFLASASPQEYNGMQFDDCVKYYDDSASNSVSVTSDDTEITHATGSNDYDLWLYEDDDSPALGCGANAKITLFIDSSYGNTCAQVVGAYGGTCHLAHDQALSGTGSSSNYTWDSNVDSNTISGYTSPPYLRHSSEEVQVNAPLNLTATASNNNITGNTFLNSTNPLYHSAVISGDNNNIWLNNFYYAAIDDSGTGNTYCHNNQGNFYEESITAPDEDCGAANFTTPLNSSQHSPSASSPLNVTWEGQSSHNTINYTLHYSDDSGSTWSFLNANTSLSHLWDISGLAEKTTYAVRLTPFDGSFNGTHVYSYFIMDNTDPVLKLMSPSDLLNTSNPDITFEFNVSDNLASTMNCSLYIRDTLNQSNTSIQNNTVAAFELQSLADNDYWWNITCRDEAGNSNHSQNRSFILDQTPPTISGITISPNSTAGVDPNTDINVNADVTDTHSIDSVILQYKRSVNAFSNISMDYNATTGACNASFTTDGIEGTYTIRVIANESFANLNISGNSTITSAHEFTWTRSPSDLGTTQGLITTSSVIGNITINNTGDDAISFDLSDNSPYGVSYNVSEPFLVSAKGVKRIRVNATFASTTREDKFNITITATHTPTAADPATAKISATINSYAGGPYLDTSIETYPSAAFQSQKGLTLSSKVRNLGNETATNTWLNWTLPAGWNNTSGNLSQYLGNLSPTSEGYNNLTVTLNASAAEAGSVLLYVNSSEAGGKTGYASSTATVYCNTTDNVCGKNCTSATDPNCEKADAGEGEGGGGGGGGGGGAGVSAPISKGKVVEGPTHRIDTVKGTVRKFPVTITNSYEDATLEDITIRVDGYLPQYLNVSPLRIGKLRFNESGTFTINIEAPPYMKYSNYTLNVDLMAEIVRVTDSNETLKTEFTDKRIINLVIHETSEENADSSLNESRKLIEEMKEAGFSTRKISRIYEKAISYYNAGRYRLAEEETERISEMKELAFSTNDIIEKVEGGVEDAEYRGIKVIETKNLLSLANVAFAREDYETAQQRAQEAQLTLLVETRGKFNIVNFVMRNYLKIIAGLIAAGIIGLLIYTRISSLLILRKMKYLDKSEIMIKDLIKQAQKECFEEKRMTVLEFHKMMYRYNKRLEKIRHQRVALRSKKVGLLRVSNELDNLKRENDYLLKLIKDVQKSYFEDRTADWETYTSKIEALNARRAEVEKELAMLEAKAILEKKKKKGGNVSVEDIEKEQKRIMEEGKEEKEAAKPAEKPEPEKHEAEEERREKKEEKPWGKFLEKRKRAGLRVPEKKQGVKEGKKSKKREESASEETSGKKQVEAEAANKKEQEKQDPFYRLTKELDSRIEELKKDESGIRDKLRNIKERMENKGRKK